MTTPAKSLLSCPFCDSEASVGHVEYGENSDQKRLNGQSLFFFVNCIKCGADNKGLVGHKSGEFATKAWNTRADASIQLRSDLEALKEKARVAAYLRESDLTREALKQLLREVKKGNTGVSLWDAVKKAEAATNWLRQQVKDTGRS